MTHGQFDELRIFANSNACTYEDAEWLYNALPTGLKSLYFMRLISDYARSRGISIQYGTKEVLENISVPDLLVAEYLGMDLNLLIKNMTTTEEINDQNAQEKLKALDSQILELRIQEKELRINIAQKKLQVLKIESKFGRQYPEVKGQRA